MITEKIPSFNNYFPCTTIFSNSAELSAQQSCFLNGWLTGWVEYDATDPTTTENAMLKKRVAELGVLTALQRGTSATSMHTTTFPNAR